MSGENDSYTIRDLERLTEFSARSIHHYISRGLLPNPEGSGPAARYGREHLLRLGLIREAKRAGFKIDQRLQEALDGLTRAEMEQLVTMAKQSTGEDVKAFGQWLLTGDWDPRAPARPRAHARATESAQDALSTSSADLDSAAIGPLQDRMPATAELLARSAPSVARQSAMRDEAHRHSHDHGSDRGGEYRRGSEPESWNRIRVGDAIEIAWRQGVSRRLLRRIEQLARSAQRWLDEEEGDRRRD